MTTKNDKLVKTQTCTKDGYVQKFDIQGKVASTKHRRTCGTPSIGRSRCNAVDRTFYDAIKNIKVQKLKVTRCHRVTVGKYISIIFLLLLFTLLRTNISAAVDTTNTVFHGVVAKVIDGDSLVVQHNNSKVAIRLYGIDAPEYQQAHARDAKRYLAGMVNGKDVMVYPLYYDSYHRVVAFLEVNGESVNKALVAAGNAWVYPHYCQADVCEKWKALQKIAQKKRTGIWQNEGAVPPWVWKHRK